MEGLRAERSIVVRLAQWGTLFALVVVMLGAYTRLSDAGLGCPDWPGCYGQLDVPSSSAELDRAHQLYPDRPVEQGKAWKEMVHRYFAGTLGLLILGIAILSWMRREEPGQRLLLPFGLLLLVIFQALLGMWTVTLLVQPAVVTLHLLGGMATTSLLWWYALRQGKLMRSSLFLDHASRIRTGALVALLLVVLQIALGGWTSTNYAALACIDFPGCYPGNGWPAMDYGAAFTLFSELGVNYEGGVLNADARTAIHMVHRIGALVVTLYLGFLSWGLMRCATPTLRGMGRLLLAVLLLQVGLGISNVLFSLPLPVAVAHNGVAALLLLVVVTINHLVNRPMVEGATISG